jgi:exodeoxyribonuclease VII large subunit
MAKATAEATAKLEKTELKAIANSPETMLKKGYTYVMSNGKIITSPQQLTEGQKITTVFMQGTVESIVTNKNTRQ